MIDTTDILLKAAEDVQSGMWCQGAMFRHPEYEATGITVLPGDHVSFTLDQLGRMKRCAIGSIALASMQLGGTTADYHAACERAATWIELPDKQRETFRDFDSFTPEVQILTYNDFALPDDPFEAGQILGDLFRRAAEGC